MCHYFSLSNDPEMSVSFKTPTKTSKHMLFPPLRVSRRPLLYLLKEGEIRNVVCKDTPFLLLLKKIQQQRETLCLKFTQKYRIGIFTPRFYVCQISESSIFSAKLKNETFLVTYNWLVTRDQGKGKNVKHLIGMYFLQLFFNHVLCIVYVFRDWYIDKNPGNFS